MSIKRKKDEDNIFKIINDMFDQFHRSLTQEFQEMMEFGGIFQKPTWKINGDICSLEPLFDIRPGKDKITIIIDLPKVNNKDDIELNISKNIIDVKAKLSKDVCYEKWSGSQKKAKFRQFEKSIRIPWTIDPDNVEAEFKDGILKITAKRLSEFKKIDIQ
ncbi:MAG: Hsp20 family protein [Candidatus Lokiarchaeota archaeon]|nr:Hsp20 family protein [Candidatus Lokiarchaeota archaeon]